MYYDKLFSADALNMYPSPIRELLRTRDINKLISFAGGYPNPATFPMDELKEIMVNVLDKVGAKSLQYAASEGIMELRKILAERYRSQGLDISHENVIICTSSQQAIDLTTKVFVDPGDAVICGLPSYLGALQSFYSYRADIHGVRSFDDAEAKIIELAGQGRKPKFIYTVPDFQNPSGETLTIAQRENLIRLARQHDLLIIEDSPYREIRYEGEDQPMLYSMDNEHVIMFGTFSKTFAPGFRIGFVIAPEAVARKIALAKQSADLCSPVFDQYVVAEYISRGLFDENLKKTTKLYWEKRDFILECFEKYMPEGVSWTRPEGGIFLFVKLPEYCDAGEIFTMALDRDVAFVSGQLFHCDGSGKNTMRINFSFVSREKTEEGVKILADAIREYMRGRER